jgi:HK97 gp10 family phage protein
VSMRIEPDAIQLDDAQMHALLQTKSGPVGRYLFQTGKRIEASAKRKAPVDTGRLRSSISTAFFEVPYDPFLAVRVGTDVEYAIYVHDGTRYVGPRPFLEEALREVVGYGQPGF